MPSETATTPLRQLLNILTSSVDKIEGIYEKAGLSYPSIDEPFNPFSESELLVMKNPEVLEASRLVVAAADQLSATVNLPSLTLFQYVGGFHTAAAIRTLVESNTVEILRDAGPKGLHVDDIAKRSGLESSRAARLLRSCAIYHIFKEISPNVFANNRLSSMMDTLKSPEEINKDILNKHTGSPGVAALVEHTTDEIMKGSTILAETLLNPNTGHSFEPDAAPMMIAFKASEPWEWFEEPSNRKRLNRFANAMEGVAKLERPGAVMSGFDFSTLEDGALIVDVGGGTGTNVMTIAGSDVAKAKKFRFVVQDRPSVIEQAKPFWEKNMPTAIPDGVVKLEAHDFFEPQPIKDANMFMLRMILHDWGRDRAIKILKGLRSGANEKTRLMVTDQIVPYAAAFKSIIDVPGAQAVLGTEPPAPLLPNLGKANLLPYFGDMQMLTGLNGEERTVDSFLDIFGESGWKIERVYGIAGSLFKQIVVVPV